MRKGVNPAKSDIVDVDDVYHRIILPVYIPNLDNYFKESFEVLKICLNSLYSTIHNKAKISIASNGCCKEVNDYLNLELEAKRIDELYIVKSGIGKINSLYKIINSTKEALITISDADVLFTSGWQCAVEEIFLEYPKAGMVCPFSYSKGYKSMTANIYFDNLFNKRIKITDIKDKNALEHFAKSIENDTFYNEIQKKYAVSYQEEGKPRALVGAGHFVATFKSGVFKQFSFNSNLKKLSSGEVQYIDLPSLKAGLWRLSTDENFVYHMGNTVMPMYENKLNKNVNDEPKDISCLREVKYQSKLLFFIKNKLFRKIFFTDFFILKFLNYRGLSKSQALEFLNKN